MTRIPLKDEKRQIGLVLGGATKIKGYFLESAKLPEIRGASALLDRINLEDVPALFGRRKYEHDPQRAERFRKEFHKRTETCIIRTGMHHLRSRWQYLGVYPHFRSPKNRR